MADENDDIERYRDGSLSNAGQHALEKKALSDPFLADALEGAESVSSKEFSADLQGFSKKMQQRQSRIWFTPLRIAASVLLLIGVGSLFYYLKPTEPVQLASEQSAGPSLTTDTAMASHKDSDSALLTLAKPDQIAREVKPSVKQPAPPDLAKADKLQRNDASKSSAGLATQTEITITQTGEEKSKIAEAEISDDKKEAVTQLQPVSAVGAGDDTKKQSRGQGKAKTNVTMSDQTNRTIQGKVTTSEDGVPLPGVTVVVKGTNQGTVTDVTGNYSLVVTGENAQLVFSCIGMHPVEVIATDKSALDVAMAEDVSQFSEVVVTGRPFDSRNELRESIVKMAAPVGGIRAYNKYLEDNLLYPVQALDKKIKGRVTVQFTVTTHGNLTDFSVVKGLGYGCDDEVIRLVKEGPKWMPTTQDDVPVENEVKVIMKFDPEKARK